MFTEIRKELRKLINEKGIRNITRADMRSIAVNQECTVAYVEKQLDYFKYSPQTKSYRERW